MKITELREKRAKLWNTMEGFLDTHRNSKGVLSAEDDATYAAMEQDLNDLTNEIRRMERRDAIEAELNKPVNTPLTAQPGKAAGSGKAGTRFQCVPRGFRPAPSRKAARTQRPLRRHGRGRRIPGSGGV